MLQRVWQITIYAFAFVLRIYRGRMFPNFRKNTLALSLVFLAEVTKMDVRLERSVQWWTARRAGSTLILSTQSVPADHRLQVNKRTERRANPTNVSMAFLLRPFPSCRLQLCTDLTALWSTLSATALKSYSVLSLKLQQ